MAGEAPHCRCRLQARLVSSLLLAVGLSAAAGTLLSCAGPDRLAGPQGPVSVPEVRVRLTRRPIEVAEVSTFGGGGHVLTVDGRTVTESAGALSKTRVTRSGATWVFNARAVQGRQAVLRTTGESYIRLGKVAYRGELRLLPSGEKGFVAINRLDIESYLAGVLPKELYAGWSSDTYRALAVAARTFALYHKLTSGAGREYDLGADQSAQVYGGFTAETDKSLDAVRYTRGVVLTAGAKGRERIFMTQYSACCGGQVNAARVIRAAPDLAPLAGGQVCTDCRGCSRYRWAPVKVAKADLHGAILARYAAAAQLKDVALIREVTHTGYGRAIWVDVVDSRGKSIRLRAEDIRLSLLRSRVPAARSLYSMNCRIRDLGEYFEFHDGRGFGHGVGLCQWGAQGKAAAGMTAGEILDFYYPGAVRLRAY